MARLHRENRYDRMTGTLEEITGRPAESVEKLVTRHIDLFAEWRTAAKCSNQPGRTIHHATETASPASEDAGRDQAPMSGKTYGMLVRSDSQRRALAAAIAGGQDRDPLGAGRRVDIIELGESFGCADGFDELPDSAFRQVTRQVGLADHAYRLLVLDDR